MKRSGEANDQDINSKKGKVENNDFENLTKENEELKLNQASLRSQVRDLRVNEASLIARLSNKEQEVQALQAELYDVNKTTNRKGDLTTLMLDPCVSILFSRMKDALAETKEKLKQSQEDYSAATFTREGKSGIQLMSRIRLLQRENEALGKQLDTGKIHKLEVELEVCKETIAFLNECKEEDTEFIEQCLKDREQQIENETLRVKSDCV
jgi:predicted  nucleic acid-binding Zn-ribbon protein